MTTRSADERLGLDLANPNPLGYAALGFLFWMHGMIFSGWFPQSYGQQVEEVSTVFAIGALLIAGVVAFLRGWTWDGTLFLFLSAFEFGVVRARYLEGSDVFWSQLWLAFALFSILLAWSALQARERRLLRGLIALGLVVVGVGWALANWGIGPEQLLTGYSQLAMGLLAFGVSAAELGVLGPADSAK